MFSAWNAPAVLTTHHLTAVRVWIAAFALALTLLGNLLLHSSHPPAGATTLLVALGTFRIITDAVTIVAGVLIVTVFSWMFRWLRVKSLFTKKLKN